MSEVARHDDRLQVDGLRKSYGAVVALRGLSLTVKAGSIHGLLGGNGSGKSTLAKVLAGLVVPDDGTILLDGERADPRRPEDSLRAGIVSTYQELSLLDEISIGENLALGRIPGRFFASRGEVRTSARGALEMVGLPHIDPAALVRTLPQNAKYMVELAKAVMWQPKLLVIDEITSALYRENVATTMQILRRLRDDGVAIIFIGHRMSEMLDICDSISVLRNGRITATFPASQTTEEQLITEMIGQPPPAPAAVGDQRADEIALNDAPLVLDAKAVPVRGQSHRPDLTARAGQIIGIAGLQGQGQSQLLRALFGVFGAVEYELDGVHIRVRNPRGAVKRRVAYVSGDRGAEGTFAIRSLTENLLAVKELVLKGRLRQPREYLTTLGVRFSKPSQPIASLSGGNQQKIVFGRWLTTAPRLLLADDATKGVDVAARRDLHELLARLAAGGAAVVFASSDEEELVELTRRVPHSVVHVMYEGAIVGSLAGPDITVERIIEASLPVERGAAA